MYPILAAFELPVLDWMVHIRAYPVMHVVALVVVVAATLRLYARDVGNAWPALDPFLVGVPAGMLGAVMLAGWTSDQPVRNPLEFPIFWQIGPKASYGGLVVGTLAAALTARMRGLPVVKFLDAGATVIPFSIAIGRLGCFLGGCCWGHPTDSLLAVRFPESHNAMFGLPEGAAGLHPTQLYLAVAALATGMVLLWLRKRGSATGARFRLFILLHAAGTLGIEFLRNDSGRWFMAGMSHSQWISLGLILLVGLYYVYRQWGRTTLLRSSRAASTSVVLIALALAPLATRAAEMPGSLFDIIAASSPDNPTGGIELEPGEGGWLATHVHLLAGTYALLDADLDGALVRFHEATRADPESPWSAQAEFVYGIGLLARSDRSGAARAFETAAEYGRGDVVPISEVLLGHMRFADGDARGAESHYRRVLEDHRSSSLADDATLGLAKALAHEGDLVGAAEVLEQSAVKYREDPRFRAPGFYDERLAWDRISELTPEQLAALVQRTIDNAVSNGGRNSVRLFIGAFGDRRTSDEMATLREELLLTLTANPSRAGDAVPASVAPTPFTAPIASKSIDRNQTDSEHLWFAAGSLFLLLGAAAVPLRRFQQR